MLTDLALADDFHRQLDQGGSAQLLLLDLKAVLNTVSDDLMTYGLTDIGVRELTFQWLSSFLQDWGDSMALEGDVCSRKPLFCEVPPVALLSLMLYNIYMCSLVQLVTSFGLGGTRM